MLADRWPGIAAEPHRGSRFGPVPAVAHDRAATLHDRMAAVGGQGDASEHRRLVNWHPAAALKPTAIADLAAANRAHCALAGPAPVIAEIAT